MLTNENLHIKKEYAVVQGSSDDWDYEVKEDGTIRLTRYKLKKSGSITIPNTIDSYLVTEVGENLFMSQTGITEVIFSDGLEIIRKNAFAGCTNIANKIHFSLTLVGTLVVNSNCDYNYDYDKVAGGSTTL